MKEEEKSLKVSFGQGGQEINKSPSQKVVRILRTIEIEVFNQSGKVKKVKLRELRQVIGRAEAAQYRNVNCEFYNACLNVASKNSFTSFACVECSLFSKKKLPP